MKATEIVGVIFLNLLMYVHLSQHHNIQSQTRVKCSLQDSQCLTTQAQNTLKDLAEGIPSLGIKKLDILQLGTVEVHTANFSYDWTNVEVDGLENAIFDNVSVDMDLKIIRVSFATPIRMKFHFDCDGVLFSALPVYGKGMGVVTFDKLLMEIIFVFDIVKNKDGKDVMNLKSYDYGFDIVDGVHFKFNDIYNGDKKKSEVLHNFINASWRAVVAHFSQYFNRRMTNKIFDAVKLYMGSRPLEELALY